jgi:deoxyadenosine/deoxycytidine kinase
MDGKSQYLIIEGPIGVGKTSLARRLSDRFGGELLLEAPQANPFLANFYRDSARFALPTQLFFLFQRANQLRELAQRDLFQKTIVGDFMLEKDPIFAGLTLGDDELSLYHQIYASVAPSAPAPDLVIYLQASPRHLIERVNRRGNPIESGISEDYLRALCDAYTRFFYQYNAAPLLMINTEHMNPAENDADLELLVERVSQMRGRREYFNRAA